MRIVTADITGSLILNNVDVTETVESSSIWSGSIASRVTSLEQFSSSIDTIYATDTSVTALSSSFSTRLTTDETNFTNNSASNASRLNAIETTGYATTGSNTFTGAQYISNTGNATGFVASAALYTDGGLRVTKDAYVSGTAYFNNMVVYGTSSIQYTTSSQVVVGASIINLNTQAPAVRYGGISVADSGSESGITGSLLWDGEKNRWIYSNPSGSSYDGGLMISGPRNTSGLGNEQGTLNNYITKGQGADHITSSQIIDDGTTVQIPGNLQVTGSLRAANLTGSLDGSNLVASSVANSKLANSSFYIGTTSISLGRASTSQTLTGTSIDGNSATVASLTPALFFNNMGQIHSTYTNFNSYGDFGFRYMQGSTNGPGTGASQYYGMTLGLGSEYTNYGCQLYWNRTSTGGNPYMSVRYLEGGSWGSWSKIYAGYADGITGNLSISGFITATGDITAYYSDVRLKENLKLIANPLEKVAQLSGYTYTTNELGRTLLNDENDTESKVGLVAQDLQKVLPEAVKLAPFDRDEDGKSKSGENYLTIQYEKVVPLLVEAIKEQQKQIEELKSIINGITK